MKTVTIHEAKTHLSQLIQQALNGEEILISKGKGEPLIRLAVIGYSTTPVLGLFKNQISISPDFDEELIDFSEYMPLVTKK